MICYFLSRPNLVSSLPNAPPFGVGGISSCFRGLSIWASLDSWEWKPGSCGLICVIRLTFVDVLSKCGVCCYFRCISKQCVHLIFISEISGISNKGVNVVGRCTGRLLQSCVAQKVRTFPHSLWVVRLDTLVRASNFFWDRPSNLVCGSSCRIQWSVIRAKVAGDCFVLIKSCLCIDKHLHLEQRINFSSIIRAFVSVCYTYSIESCPSALVQVLYE